jgi:hypothetical protein
MFKGLVAVSQLSHPESNPEADMKALGVMGGAMSEMDDGGRALLYPQARTLAAKKFPQLQLPEQYDPKVWSQIQPLFKQMAGGKAPEGFTMSPGQKRFDANGTEAAAASACGDCWRDSELQPGP